MKPRPVTDREVLPFECAGCGATSRESPCPLCGATTYSHDPRCADHHCIKCGGCFTYDPDEEVEADLDPEMRDTWTWQKARYSAHVCEDCKKLYRQERQEARATEEEKRERKGRPSRRHGHSRGP